ncbi:hypothetical protein TVAG_300240 [Trichomonas vaginalis G3]|uniref:Uncharacterized protein n=1 Tax=Trichomonas vaginalis (strain ATCC PRA-98 / G3) TaxID=412133 RepID=A2FYK2_TRIV3|nr:tubby, C-terminal family [Trichomonas vaginalis G3]EAX90006.1 hypothetical protein TVAG_300240 [Trichomonas vaginalis G3]KAI5532077.1 tubby, C-terminal family [Trichomonas vaginalis G3]|eukprot:XP_001302936.1 hypothetical protein [Trichomonas vaginalis G3]
MTMNQSYKKEFVLKVDNRNAGKSYLMTRRQKKGDKIRYYLYTEDEEQLILAGIHENKTENYLVATSAIEYKKDSEFYVGLVECVSHQTSYLIHSPDSKQIKVLMLGEGRSPHVFLNPDHITDEELHLRPQVNLNCSSDLIQISMLKKDKVVFDLKQIYKDEFKLYCTEPLTLYESFGIAICICLIQS